MCVSCKTAGLSSSFMAALFGGLVEVSLTSVAEAERPPLGSLSPKKSCLPSLGSLADSFAGASASAFFFRRHASQPVSRAQRLMASASATWQRASTRSALSRIPARPLFSKSVVSCSTARAMVTRKAAAAVAWGSVFGFDMAFSFALASLSTPLNEVAEA